MSRRSTNTTLDRSLYQSIRGLHALLEVNINKLIEDGMHYVLEKYKDGITPEQTAINKEKNLMRIHNRESTNTSLDGDLYKKLRLMSILTKQNTNELLEEAMEYVVSLYPEEMKKINEELEKINHVNPPQE